MRFEGVQALRAIAAGMVVFGHGLVTYREKVGEFNDFDVHGTFGSLAVKLFFCISGYIIYTSTNNTRSGIYSAGLFFRRRLIRIVPLYWCATAIYAAKLAFQGVSPSLVEILESLFFLPYKSIDGLMRPVLGLGWTLNFEMFFYLLMGLTLVFTRRYRLHTLAMLLVAMVVLRHFDFLALQGDRLEEALFLLSDQYLLFFIAGMLVVEANKVFGKGLGLFVINWIPAIYGISLLILFYIVLESSLSMDPWLRTSLEIGLCYVSVLVCVNVSSHSDAVGGSGVRNAVILAGDGSYSTYLTHGFVMGPSARLIDFFGVQFNPWIFAAGMVVLCTCVGMLIFRWVEDPLLRKMNAAWASPRQC